MAVLVTGGAGFIGSHTVMCLREAGRDVVVLDDLSSGIREAVPAEVPLIVSDVADEDALGSAIERHDVDAIVHFAGRLQGGESVVAPRKYWRANVLGTFQMLEAALDAGVRRVIFSSTAAVYGTPERVPIDEGAPTRPISPYGETKLAVERMLASYTRAYDVAYAALRYFTAAGADPTLGLGEHHDPETHLIPLVLDAALGRRPAVTVFGRDYPTPDGTCVRDYIHVKDLAEAHLCALEHLERGGAGGAFNLGTGTGHSVDEVIATCRKVTRREIPVVDGPRRQGDPAELVASPCLAEERLGWKATRSSLERIVTDAWEARRTTPPERGAEPTSTPSRRQGEERADVR